MGFLPTHTFCGIGLRKWCIYGGLTEFIIFIIPSFYYLIVWNEKQEDNRMLFGIILILTLTLSVCLGIGGYNRDGFFIMMWIIGTILVQYSVNIIYSLMYVFKLTKITIWGYSTLETTFTIVQSLIGLVLLYTALAYYIVLDKRYKERLRIVNQQMKDRKMATGNPDEKKKMEQEKKKLMEEMPYAGVSKLSIPQKPSRKSLTEHKK